MSETAADTTDAPASVLITGASSGIGLAAARAFASEGARVALIARGEEGLSRAADAVRQAGGEPLVLPADVTDRDAIAGAVRDAAAKLGGIDVGVVNAGAGAYGPAADQDLDHFDRTIAVTLTGAVNTIQPLLPELERASGSLVVVGSAAGQVPLPMQAGYCAAKHGLRAYTDVLDLELRGRDSEVSVSMITPGPIDTPFWDHVAAEGVVPPPIPGAYGPEEVAVAIVDAARTGRRDTTVGGLTALARAAHHLLTPVTDAALVQFSRFAETREGTLEAPSGIEEPSGEGELRTGLPLPRPSVVIRGRSALDSVVRSVMR